MTMDNKFGGFGLLAAHYTPPASSNAYHTCGDHLCSMRRRDSRCGRTSRGYTPPLVGAKLIGFPMLFFNEQKCAFQFDHFFDHILVESS